MKSWNFITHKQKLHWGYRILLMENQGKAFGSIYWYFDEPRDLYIDMISVLEESQQKGLGTFLLKKLEYICVNDLSAEKISLWTFKNSWTKKWYNRCGYKDAEPNESEPETIWMEKRINSF